MRCADVITSCSELVFCARPASNVLTFTSTIELGWSYSFLAQPGHRLVAYNVSDPLFTILRRS